MKKLIWDTTNKNTIYSFFISKDVPGIFRIQTKKLSCYPYKGFTLSYRWRILGMFFNKREAKIAANLYNNKQILNRIIKL